MTNIELLNIRRNLIGALKVIEKHMELKKEEIKHKSPDAKINLTNNTSCDIK